MQKGEADDFVPNDTSGLFAKWNTYRSRLARRIGDGDRWMVGGLVSPGSTVRRLTSVRGFYYDVLESCGIRRKEGRSFPSFPHTESAFLRKASIPSPFCPRPLDSLDLHPPIFTPFFGETRIYYAWKKTWRHELTERSGKLIKATPVFRSLTDLCETVSCDVAINHASILEWMLAIEIQDDA